MIAVHAARDVDRSANEAIRSMFAFDKLHLEVPAARAIHRASADSWMRKMLKSQAIVATDSALLDWLYETYAHAPCRGSKDRCDIFHKERAVMMFYHPKLQDPDPLLAYFHAIREQPENRIFYPTHISEAQYTWSIASSLMNCLRGQSRFGDVAFVKRLSERFAHNLRALQKDAEDLRNDP